MYNVVSGRIQIKNIFYSYQAVFKIPFIVFCRNKHMYIFKNGYNIYYENEFNFT